MSVLALIAGLVVAPIALLGGSASADVLPTIAINEVESNGGTPGDWIELTNVGAVAVDVSGMILKDNDDTHSFAIPSGTTIDPGGFYVADVDVSYGLGGGDTARLFDVDGTTLVSSYTWMAHASTTYGRCPDGTGEFRTTTSSTRGAANDCSVPPPTTIKINEVESSGGTPGDWIELTNIGADSVDISGLVLKDNDDTHAFVMPASTSLAAGAYAAFDVETGFGLGGADSARLFATNGTTLLDTYTWTEHAATTYGRCPNGTGAFAVTTSSTRAAANDCAAVAAPVVTINEIESSGGTPGDWIELHNAGPSLADVSGYILKDNDNTHAFAIPAGTTIAAGAFYVADVDPLFGLGAADTARLLLPDGGTVVDLYTWTAHAPTSYGRCPDGAGVFAATTTPTRGAANDCSGTALPSLVINEIESNGGTPGDWIELLNTGGIAVDASGLLLKDNDDTHVFAIPAGTSIAAGGYYVADVEPAFGLGGADTARLLMADGTTSIDSYAWTAHATTTYGRCPTGTGTFVETALATRGTANICPGDVIASPWPGGTAVTTVDVQDYFTTNMSGLAYEAGATGQPDVLWAVKNGPGTLYRLLWNGSAWVPDTANGWASGKLLHYPDGTGNVDAEGVTLVDGSSAGGVYVSTERDNTFGTVSRPEILRVDVSGSAPAINATVEYNLTADLPVVAPNSGLEAIAWVPDSYLVAGGFFDERTGGLYDPATYPGHGSGLFLVGLEANGSIYAYALDGVGGYQRVATIASGFVSIMDLEFEPETQTLWAACDNTCGGRSAVLDIAQPYVPVAAGAPVAQAAVAAGRLGAVAVYERPSGLGDYNNEGFAITPQSACVDGLKPVFWSDDDNSGGHALRAGTITCTELPEEPDPTPTPDPTTDPATTDPATTGPTTSTGPALIGAAATVSPVAVGGKGTLASTGADGVSGAALGLVLLAVGLALAAAARRRQGTAAAHR